MKVIQKTLSASALSETDYRESFEIEVDEKCIISILDGEPEDNNISRNFAGVFRITELMKMAFEAGVSGETFEIEEIEVDSCEVD